MRSWHIAGLSALAAIIGVGVWLMPGTPITFASLIVLVQSDWPRIVVVGLGSYGIAVSALTTAVLLVEMSRARTRALVPASRSSRSRSFSGAVILPARRYFAMLGVAQYYTAIGLLLAFGIWQQSEKGSLWPPVPRVIFASRALQADAALVLLGLLLGALVVAIAIVASRRKIVGSTAMESTELQVLRQILDKLNSQPSVSQIGTLIEVSQRPVLESIKDLATAVNRVSRTLHHNFGEVKDALLRAPAEQAGPVSSELHAAVTALTTTINAIEQVSSIMATHPVNEAFRGSAISSTSLLELSNDLSTLLRELETDT